MYNYNMNILGNLFPQHSLFVSKNNKKFNKMMRLRDSWIGKRHVESHQR